MRQFTFVILLVGLCACGSNADHALFQTTNPETKRWYSLAEAKQGETLYTFNCSGCHGAQAQGDFQINSTTLPIPPLDSKGHLWRMPIESYLQILDTGRGRMPSVSLEAAEKLLVLAFIQQQWPESKYKLWVKLQALQ